MSKMSKYRDEPQGGGSQRLLLIVLAILFIIFLFTGLVWPGFWV